MSLGKKKILSQGAAGGVVATDNFQTITYTGNGGTQSTNSLSNQSGTLNFQPDFTWIKSRSGSVDHNLIDSVRGNFILNTNRNIAQEGGFNGIVLNSNGFTVDANPSGGGTTVGEINVLGQTYVAWNWYAPTSENNTSGTIASTIKKNIDSGFSIVKWTGDGNASATVGHGISTPDMIITKSLTDTNDWNVNHIGIPNKIIYLHSPNAAFSGGGTNGAFGYQSTNTSTTFGFTGGSSSVNNVNKLNSNYIAYCFHSVAGYQKVGSYTGTGNAGNTVDVGFTPSWLMTKRSNSTGPWMIFDNKRNPSNPRNTRLGANLTAGDASFSVFNIDFDSTSFTLNGTDPDINGGSDTYIYLAIA